MAAMEGARKRILLLLDMNGTLCYRSKVSVLGVGKDARIGKMNVYARPGLKHFVRELSESGDFMVCVYTSMMRHNALKGVHAILEEDAVKVERVFDRSMNKQDPLGTKPWDTVRDMKKVWQTTPGFGPKNTLLVDNEFRKLRETPENGLVIAECDEAELRSKSTKSLDSMLNYLLKVGKASPEDVTAYVRTHPYKASSEEAQPSELEAAQPSELEVAESSEPEVSIEDLTARANKLSLSERLAPVV